MHSSHFKVAKKIANRPFFIKSNIATGKKSSFDYLIYRFLRPLLKVYYRSFRVLNKPCPWTSPASIIFFRKVLTKQMIGFEYGSGTSTIFFSKYLKNLVSLEHHEGWFEKVSNSFKKMDIKNVEYHLVAEENHSFEKYSGFILNYPDGYFDFILIDGRARVQCTTNAIEKLKSGGILVVDNSERARYEPIHTSLSGWNKINTTTGLTDTTIWIKP